MNYVGSKDNYIVEEVTLEVSDFQENGCEMIEQFKNLKKLSIKSNYTIFTPFYEDFDKL